MKEMVGVEIVNLQEKLNQINFVGCENIRVGEMLHYSISGSATILSGFKALARIVAKICLCHSYNCKVKGQPNTVCLFSNSYRGRADHLKAFQNAASILPNCVEMTCSKYHLDFANIKYLKYLLSWNSQMKQVVKNFGLRMRFTSILLQALTDYEFLERLCNKNNWVIKCFVTFCDVMPIDSFFTQKFNRNGVTTVTLQHGTFAPKTNGWAYLGSYSDYFLADSQSTIDAAAKMGYHNGIMLAVGSPHHIGEQGYEQKRKYQINTIGIIMNSPMFPIEDNLGMIKLLQDYCRREGKKLMLKYHPANNLPDYKKYIDTNITTEYGKEISITDFASKIDMAIVSTSTVFTTMLRYWIPTALFVREGYDAEMFINTEQLKISNQQQLEQLIVRIEGTQFVEKMQEYRDYFLVKSDIKLNYIEAFKKIGAM